MGRPFYPHEADDPDLDWLVSNFLYDRPDYLPVESGMLPLVLIPVVEDPENLEHEIVALVDDPNTEEELREED